MSDPQLIQSIHNFFFLNQAVVQRNVQRCLCYVLGERVCKCAFFSCRGVSVCIPADRQSHCVSISVATRPWSPLRRLYTRIHLLQTGGAADSKQSRCSTLGECSLSLEYWLIEKRRNWHTRGYTLNHPPFQKCRRVYKLLSIAPL